MTMMHKAGGTTIVNIGGSDARLRGTNQVFAGDIDESMQSFQYVGSSQNTTKEFIRAVTRSSRGRKLAAYMILNLVTTAILLLWTQMSNSMSMTALAYMTVFDLSYLLTAAVSIWVSSRKPSPIYSFGYERFEVLSVFASTMLAQLGSFFIFKESVERMFEPHHIHEGRLPLGAGLAFLVHSLIIYSTENLPFQHVIQACSSSWLQEHVTDISESLCHVLPTLSKLLLPRINPLTLLGFASTSSVAATYIAIDMKNYQGADVAAAVCIAVFTIGTMWPMATYTGRILLQTTPTHMIGSLDKCLREACTLDGVLEFRNEHFWTLGFGKMAGSVHVRVRRDANDQLVLAHVYNRLSSIVSQLTIQIFKDDWSRSTAYQIIHNTSMPPPITPIKPVTHPIAPSLRPNYNPLPVATGSQAQPWTSTPYGTPSKPPNIYKQ
ncbi:zinc transporter 6-A-like [Watersipora subatra]|uniref:zinc transporter 6-A-like n=1 Tax=Watersipora subatra TaxID=2589382 RepID=UPI00355B2BD3